MCLWSQTGGRVQLPWAAPLACGGFRGRRPQCVLQFPATAQLPLTTSLSPKIGCPHSLVDFLSTLLSGQSWFPPTQPGAMSFLPTLKQQLLSLPLTAHTPKLLPWMTGVCGPQPHLPTAPASSRARYAPSPTYTLCPAGVLVFK